MPWRKGRAGQNCPGHTRECCCALLLKTTWLEREKAVEQCQPREPAVTVGCRGWAGEDRRVRAEHPRGGWPRSWALSQRPLSHGKAVEWRASEKSTGQLRVCDLIWVPWKPGEGQEWSQETLRVFWTPAALRQAAKSASQSGCVRKTSNA